MCECRPFISSIPLPMEKYPEIAEEFENGFYRDCSEYSNAILWFALGSDVEAILRSLQECGKIRADAIILSIPHPSGANAGRIAAFLGTNAKDGKAENKAREQAAECHAKMKALREG